MAEEVEIKVKDGVSGPAHAAADSVRGLDRVLQTVRSTANSSFGTKAFDAIRAGSKSTTDAIKKIQDEYKRLRHEADKPIDLKVTAGGGSGVGGIDKLLGAFKGEGGGLSGLAAGGAIGAALAGATAVLDVVKAIGKEVLSLTVQGAQLAIQMSNWKTSTLAMLTNITGSRAGGEQLLAQAKGIARLTGESTEDVVGRMKKLIADGFSPKAADKILHAVADVSAGRDKESGDKLQKTIELVKNKDKAGIGDLRKLAGSGVDTGDVYAELARRTHKSIEMVKADLKAGRIEGNLAAAAIASAAEKRYGGAAKVKSDNDIEVLLSRVHDGFKELFSGVKLGPIVGALQNVDKVLQGAGGKALKGSISSFFGQLFHTLFDPFNGAGGQKKLEQFAAGASQAIDRLTGLLKAAAPYVDLIAKGFANLGGKDEKGVSGLDKMLTMFGRIFEIVKLISGMSGDPLGSIAKIFAPTEATKAPKAKGIELGIPVANAMGTLDTAGIAAEQASPFGAVGDAMVDGVVNSVNAGKSRVEEACRAMGAAGVAGARAGVDAHSPSRKFAEIGLDSVMGYAGAISANDRLANSAAASMARGSAAAAAVGPPGAGGGGAAGAPTFHINVPVTAHASGAAEGKAAGDAAAEPVTNAVRDGVARGMREWREAG